ncbi:MAG: 2Fe-2S iron-sulfur cluster-binding protein [Desulfobacteraceae bacterium]|jgi:succinate dehydrogenase / fumarate reductase iron-sulfur subunit
MSEMKKNAETKFSRQIEFKIFRYKPNCVGPSRYDSFKLDVTSDMVVLDCLEKIRLKQDDTLMYRHSCHHSACGTCALIINGSERLACITRVLELKSKSVVLEPLRRFKLLGDLVVDMSSFYEHIDPDWSLLKPVEPLPNKTSLFLTQSSIPIRRLENCIECGACISACPAMRSFSKFMGPAALAAIACQMQKVSSKERKVLLKFANGPNGQRICDRRFVCSRVCPTQVYPARQIADLRKLLGLPKRKKATK